MNVAVIGRADRVHRKSRQLGELLAQAGHVVITGACGGTPGAVEQSACQAGGRTLGFSPASDSEGHLKLGLPPRGTLPTEYTGRGFKGRNVDLIMATKVAIVVGGRLGTLHEAITAVEEDRPVYACWTTGGAALLLYPVVWLLRREFCCRVRLCWSIEQAVNLLGE